MMKKCRYFWKTLNLRRGAFMKLANQAFQTSEKPLKTYRWLMNHLVRKLFVNRYLDRKNLTVAVGETELDYQKES